MIWHGVKRPPPMGSELDKGLLPEGDRGIRMEEANEGVFRGAGAAGPIVAPSKLASSPRKVAPVSGSNGSPHEEQNLPFAETRAPHFSQNMGGRDSIIAAETAANACPGS